MFTGVAGVTLAVGRVSGVVVQCWGYCPVDVDLPAVPAVQGQGLHGETQKLAHS